MKFPKIRPPKFEPVTVADKLQDGYWVQAVDVRRVPKAFYAYQQAA
jgi:hypothetical protein